MAGAGPAARLGNRLGTACLRKLVTEWVETPSRADIVLPTLPEADASKSLDVAARHLPHAQPQSNLDTYRAANARQQGPASQTSRDIPAPGQDAENIPGEEQQLPHPSSYSQAALHVPDKNHSPSSTNCSGYSQCSCINIIINLILMSFGFNTSWQRLPRTENSQLMNDS